MDEGTIVTFVLIVEAFGAGYLIGHFNGWLAGYWSEHPDQNGRLDAN